MYPREYTWISDPTKVISRTKAIDKGSMRSPAWTDRLPADTQSHSWTDMERSSAPSPLSCRTMRAPTTKLPQESRVASRGPNLSVARPPSSSRPAPTRGSAISSQARAEVPVASTARTALGSASARPTDVSSTDTQLAPYSFSRLASSTEAERQSG